MDKVITRLSFAGVIAAGALAGMLVPGQTGQATSSRRGGFSICHTGGGVNCVVDGDTAWIDGTKVRIADIDAPETHPSRCASEDRLGDQATVRLAALMNEGSFDMKTIGRDEDRYGRKLRILSRGGQSLGGQLVHEGLARWYGSGRRPWC